MSNVTRLRPYDWEIDGVAAPTMLLPFSPLEVSLIVTALEQASSSAARDLAGKVKDIRRTSYIVEC